MLLSIKTFLIGAALAVGSFFGIHDTNVGSIINPPETTASVSGTGTVGKAVNWLTSTTIGAGALIDNGTVAGINATSSTITFTVRGGAGVNPFSVASSSGATLFHVAENGSIGIGTSTFTSPYAGKLTIDATTASSTEGMGLLGNINNFFEYNVVNYSAGAGAQACHSATNNLGTVTTGFVALCANSSGFNNPTAFNTGGAGDTSIMGYSSGDFIVANATSTRSILFVAGGSATTTFTRMSISGNGAVVIATTTTPTYGFTVATSTQFLGDLVPRSVAYTASTSVAINTANTDIATITVAHATTTFTAPTGTLYNGKMFEIMLTATTTRGLAWATGTGAFASSTDLAIPITTASGTAKYIYEYRTNSARWELNGLITGFAN